MHLTKSEKISKSLMGHPVLPETRGKISAKQKGIPKKKCRSGCSCGKHHVSKETRLKLSEVRKGKRWGKPTSEKYLSSEGYWVLTGLQGHHPLIADREVRAGVERGEVLEHRAVLWTKLGCESIECLHECHWCGKQLSWSQRIYGIQADHIDGDRTNNAPENIVPSCGPCNIRRGTAGNPADWKP